MEHDANCLGVANHWSNCYEIFIPVLGLQHVPRHVVCSKVIEENLAVFFLVIERGGYLVQTDTLQGDHLANLAVYEQLSAFGGLIPLLVHGIE